MADKRSGIDAKVARALAALPARTQAALVLDAAALRANIRQLQSLAPRSEVAAVVKSNGYGLGAARVISEWMPLGLKTVFVATVDEGVALRSAFSAPDDTEELAIYVLDGLLPNTIADLCEWRLRPVLSSVADVDEWQSASAMHRYRPPVAVHIDTGMTRQGMTPDEFGTLAVDGRFDEPHRPALLMSHLACADTPEHRLNQLQLDRFEACHRQLADVPCSLANSAGVLAVPDSHYDIVRPGIAVFGGRALDPSSPNTMNTVVRAFARVVRLMVTTQETTVGYGATQTVPAGRTLATLAIGYADGFSRRAGPGSDSSCHLAKVGEVLVPLVGRVSMDLMVADVSQADDRLYQRGQWIEVIGPGHDIDDLADAAGTIGYEVLTRLGPRLPRVWIDTDDDTAEG